MPTRSIVEDTGTPDGRNGTRTLDRDDIVNKALAFAVQKGRKVTFYPFDHDIVTGYIAGMTARSFFVLEPDGDSFREKYILRDGCSVIEVDRESTFTDEPAHEDMEVIINKFRTWVMNNFFNKKSPRSRTTGTDE